MKQTIKTEHKETKYYYWVSFPIYKSYKNVRHYTHCDDCGHVTGSYTYKVGIGKPIRIDWKRHKKDTRWYMSQTMKKIMIPKIVENIMKPSIAFSNL